MKQKFLSSFFIVLALNFLFKPIWILFVDRNFQNILGAEEYGLYFSLFSFSLVFNIFLDLGITNFNNKNIAQHPHLLPKYFTQIIFVKLILGLFYLLLVFIFAAFLNYSKTALSILFWLSVNQFLSSFSIYLRSNISALQKFVLDGFFSVLDKFFMVLICGILLYCHYHNILPLKIEYLVYAQTISFFITCLALILLNLRYVGKIKLQFKPAFNKLILKQSFYFALYVFIVSIYLRADVVMLERMVDDGKTHAGIYAQVYRLIDVFSIVGYLFAGILLPLFASKLAAKNTHEIKEILKTASSLLIFSSIIVAVFCSFYTTEIMQLLYHEYIPESAYLFQILLLLFVFTSIHYIYSTLLTANGNVKELSKISFIGLTISLVLNYIFILKWKSVGVAYTALITNLVVTILLFRLVKIKFSFIQLNQGLLKKIGFIIWLFILAFTIKNYLPLAWGYQTIAFFTLAFASAMWMKVIPSLLELKRTAF